MSITDLAITDICLATYNIKLGMFLEPVFSQTIVGTYFLIENMKLIIYLRSSRLQVSILLSKILSLSYT